MLNASDDKGRHLLRLNTNSGRNNFQKIDLPNKRPPVLSLPKKTTQQHCRQHITTKSGALEQNLHNIQLLPNANVVKKQKKRGRQSGGAATTAGSGIGGSIDAAAGKKTVNGDEKNTTASDVVIIGATSHL